MFTTANQIGQSLRAHGITTADDDLDDLMQLLRMKVFYALRRFDGQNRRRTESRLEARDRFVFMCLQDTKKDIAKKKRALLLMIEDVAPGARGADAGEHGPRDAFEARYLSQDHEETFGLIEATLPLIPNTLSELERGVLVLLYRDFSHREIAERLGVNRGEVSSAVRALRSKLADWRPAQEVVAPVQPLAA